MSNKPQLRVRAEQPYAAIPIRATFKEWGQVNALIPEVFGWLGRNGINPAGPLFYRYWVVGGMDEKFTIEVGVPVDSPVSGDGRVVAGSIPGGSYATLTHHGHPDTLTDSLNTLQGWAKNQGIEWDNRTEGTDEVWGGRFEFHLTDPAEQPDLSQWDIELAFLVRTLPA